MEILKNYFNAGDALAFGFYLAIFCMLIIEIRSIWKARKENEGKKFRNE
ncbi:MAG: hypothetical protein L6Q78_11140 [Bacteroidia bacterium]|nr:hypothetical protein [Bacteroidia bacterium]